MPQERTPCGAHVSRTACARCFSPLHTFPDSILPNCSNSLVFQRYYARKPSAHSSPGWLVIRICLIAAVTSPASVTAIRISLLTEPFRRPARRNRPPIRQIRTTAHSPIVTLPQFGETELQRQRPTPARGNLPNRTLTGIPPAPDSAHRAPSPPRASRTT